MSRRHSYHYRSSRPSRRHRNRIGENEDDFPGATDQAPLSANVVDEQPSLWNCDLGTGDDISALGPHDAASHGTGDAGTTFDANPDYHRLPFQLDETEATCPYSMDGLWQRTPSTYQLSDNEWYRLSTSPAASSPLQDPLMTYREASYGQFESTGFQSDQSWAASTPQNGNSEVDNPSDRASRRWSLQARQGSDVGLSGLIQYDNVTGHVAMDQHLNLGKNDSSDSEGDSEGDAAQMTRDQYVRGCLSSGTAPWSSEFPRQPYGHHSPY